MIQCETDFGGEHQIDTHEETEMTDLQSGDEDATEAEEGISVATTTLVEQVQEALSLVPQSGISIESLPTETQENELVASFVNAGCGCKLWNGSNCSLQFSKSDIESERLSCFALSRCELDMALLGQIMAKSNTSSNTSTTSRHSPVSRQKTYTKYFHQGKVVCPSMFRFLHAIGTMRLKSLVKHYKQNGLTPRTHGNTRRLPSNTLSVSSVEYIVRFLLNYSDQHGLLLPGRIPGYSRSDIKLLPSSLSKRSLWRVYHQSADSAEDVHAVAYSTFCILWQSLLPAIIIMKPMTDLCWECQRNSAAILRAANFPVSEKSATIKTAEEHLRIVQMERSFYKSISDECRQAIKDHFSLNGSFTPPPPNAKVAANSSPIKAHYSFDFAQTVHFPSDPLQPGPIYFLTPRKCSVIGVHCEALPRQINFLIDESFDCGKGANVVISMLHYFFDHHGLGEKEVYLHADNCTGQNKNSAVMQYLMWRVLSGKHTKIMISFLVVGHTKFAPDWCFGLFKRLYRRTKLGSMKGIADVVDNSADCNYSQLVASEDGSTIVPAYNWTDFFATKLKKIIGIKKNHHFRFDSTSPGVVHIRERCDTSEHSLDLLKAPWEPRPTDLPTVMHPKSLSAERQWYLYNQIRPFCPDLDKDATCPLPSVPLPSSRSCTPVPPSLTDAGVGQGTAEDGVAGAGQRTAEDDVDDDLPPPKKQRRVCSLCKQEGHNRRSCTKQ